MKSIMFLLVSIIFTALFTACNDDVEKPAADFSAVQVKLETTTAPMLKEGDGDDDEDPDPMFTIKGLVTENGSPVIAVVELVSEQEMVDSTVTSENGEFVFYEVPAGSYNLVVKINGSVAGVEEIVL